MQLKKIKTKVKSSNERFTHGNQEIDFELLDFWKWSLSDLVSNSTRGKLAEFIVAKALGVDTNIARDEWQAYDLLTPEGIKIEVKSAAYIQSWYQKKLSTISFSIKKSRYWDAETNEFASEATRQADAYIFALLAHKEKETIDPLNLDQWEFYVLPVEVINNYQRSEHSITLPSLRKLADPVMYGQLKTKLMDRSSIK